MRKVITTCSALCGIIALLALVLGVRGLFGSSDFIVGLAIFRFTANGTFMSFLGNVLSIVVMVYGFGMMSFLGFDGSSKSKSRAFKFGVVMTAICIISLIIAIIGGTFTIGDLFIAGLPAIYTLAILKSA